MYICLRESESFKKLNIFVMATHNQFFEILISFFNFLCLIFYAEKAHTNMRLDISG